MLELDWHVSESRERVSLEWDQHQLEEYSTCYDYAVFPFKCCTLETMHALYYHPDKMKQTPPIIVGYVSNYASCRPSEDNAPKTLPPPPPPRRPRFRAWRGCSRRGRGRFESAFPVCIALPQKCFKRRRGRRRSFGRIAPAPRPRSARRRRRLPACDACCLPSKRRRRIHSHSTRSKQSVVEGNAHVKS